MDDEQSPTIYRFPSGHVFALQMPVYTPNMPTHTAGDGKTRLLARPATACKYVGKSLEVRFGCGGIARHDSVWECTKPGLTGKCAPLANYPIAKTDCVTCALCGCYEADAAPGYVRLGVNLTSAMTKWALKGRPTRTQPQVDKLLAVCQSCPFYSRKETGSTFCGKCGCPVNDKVDATKNKLAMATESCPLEPPRWTADAT